MNKLRLNQKVIVVTGGSGLLGKEFLKEIREQGGIGINGDLNCSKDLEKFEYCCDISDEESVKEFIAEVIKKYNKIDGWVNNAYPRTKDWGLKFEDIPLASWRENVDKHMNGYFICSQLILEQMKKQNQGSVINMASIYGMNGPDFTIYENTNITNPAGYAAIKGGIINLTRYLASYYGPFNIRVNAISPGGIFDNQQESFVKNYVKKVPMKRMAVPQDISPSVIFLLADDSVYITGHNLVIDGGWSII